MNKFDLAIIGGGPGGYVAALKAAKHNYKVALIEKSHLGGTCLNRGCIPSKTLLKNAEVIDNIQHSSEWGVTTENFKIDLNKIMYRKDNVINTLRNGINHLMKVNKIKLFNGNGTIVDNKSIKVNNEKITADKIIIATGSEPFVPDIPGLRSQKHYTTDNIFDIKEIPKSLTIIGGGVIGIEIACIFSSFNTKVTIIEQQDRILSTEDEDASALMLKKLTAKNIRVLVRNKITKIQSHTINIINEEGKENNIAYENILIATGRKPNTDVIGEVGIERKNNFIKVNSYFQTNIKNIYAIGDVIGNLQLAHVASAEGLVAVENIKENNIKKIDYNKIPNCVYSKPQIASIGKKEFQLKKENIDHYTYKFNMSANGMALATGDDNGFCKISIDAEYGEILGATIVCDNAVDIIGQINLNMMLEGTISELAEVVQPHPSLSESIMESANYLITKI